MELLKYVNFCEQKSLIKAGNNKFQDLINGPRISIQIKVDSYLYICLALYIFRMTYKLADRQIAIYIDKHITKCKNGKLILAMCKCMCQ